MDNPHVRILRNWSVWNELFSGQSDKSLHVLANNLEVAFPDKLIDQCYLVISGIERSVYRKLGVDASSYLVATEVAWNQIASKLDKMGFQADHAMNFYDNQKLIFYILSPRKNAAPISKAARVIQETLQTTFEESFHPQDAAIENCTVYSCQLLHDTEELYAVSCRLRELHEYAFFIQEPTIHSDQTIIKLRIPCDVDSVHQKVFDLLNAIQQRDIDQSKEILSFIVRALKDNLNKQLCYRIMEEIQDGMKRINGVFELKMEDLSNLDIRAFLKFSELSVAVWSLVKRQIKLLSLSNRNYSYLTRSVILYLKYNYRDDITLNSLASQMNIAPAYLSRVFNRDMNTSIPQYILRLRLGEARSQIKSTKKGVSEIAASCGFQSMSYFSKMFRREFGVTPSQMRHRLAEEPLYKEE